METLGVPTPKVAIIHNTVAPYRHSLFEKLSEYPYDITVFYCSHKHSNRRWESFPRKYKYKHIFLKGVTIKNISINPTAINQILKGKFDVIVLYGWIDVTMQMLFVLAKFLKMPIVLWIENIKEPDSFIGLLTKPVRKYFLLHSNAILTPGDVSRNYAIALGAQPSRVFIAPNTIDNEYFINLSSIYKSKKEKIKKELGIKQRIIFLCVSQLVARKGISYLVLAFEKLQKEFTDVLLVLIGSGPIREKIIRLCNDRKIPNVLLIPSGLSQDSLIKFYSAADVFILPAISDRAPLVINEALACGLPVITTRGAGNSARFIINGVNGFVVSTKNVDELHQAMSTIIGNNELRISMGNNALKFLRERLSLDKSARAYMSTIGTQLSNHTRNHANISKKSP